MLRDMARKLLPSGIAEAPKRPLQTPQREWLAGPLRGWAEDHIAMAVAARPDWFDGVAVRNVWREYLAGASDNSFYVWQWINAGLMFNRVHAASYE